MPKREHILLLIPYIASWIMSLPTWLTLITAPYETTWQQQLALGLLLVNLAVYYRRFRWGVMMTGGLLLLATGNLLVFTVEKSTTSFWVSVQGREAATPYMQTGPLWLLIFWIIIHLVYTLKRHPSGGNKQSVTWNNKSSLKAAGSIASRISTRK